jgi:hypothetical protein
MPRPGGSNSSGPIRYDPTCESPPCLTPGPLGRNDAADPNRGAEPVSLRMEAFPLTKVPSIAEYNQVTRFFTFRFLHLLSLTRLTVPPGIRHGRNVTVGYILNVLKRRMDCKYSGTGRKITGWLCEQHLLDALGDNYPWYGVEPFAASLNYNPGTSVEVIFTDTPGASYWNYYNNDESGGELSFIKESIDFAIWLAARESAVPAQDWKRYSVLWSAQFTLWGELKVLKPLSRLRAEIRQKGMETYRSLGEPLFEFKADVKNFKEGISLTPVLAPPLANDVHRELIPREVYGSHADVAERRKRIQQELENFRNQPR